MSTLTTHSALPIYVLNSVLKRHLILSRDFYETFRFNNKMAKFKFSRKVTKLDEIFHLI